MIAEGLSYLWLGSVVLFALRLFLRHCVQLHWVVMRSGGERDVVIGDPVKRTLASSLCLKVRTFISTTALFWFAAMHGKQIVIPKRHTYWLHQVLSFHPSRIQFLFGLCVSSEHSSLSFLRSSSYWAYPTYREFQPPSCVQSSIHHQVPFVPSSRIILPFLTSRKRQTYPSRHSEFRTPLTPTRGHHLPGRIY